MRVLLRVLNPFIFVWNVFCYFVHLEGQRHNDVYEHYDFSKDLRYF